MMIFLNKLMLKKKNSNINIMGISKDLLELLN